MVPAQTLCKVTAESLPSTNYVFKMYSSKPIGNVIERQNFRSSRYIYMCVNFILNNANLFQW